MIPVSEFKEGLDFALARSSLDEVIAVTDSDEIKGGLCTQWCRDVPFVRAVAWFDNRVWYGTFDKRVGSLDKNRATGTRPGAVVRFFVHNGVLYDLCVENHRSLLVYKTNDNEFVGTVDVKLSGNSETVFRQRSGLPSELAVSAETVVPYMMDLQSDGSKVYNTRQRIVRVDDESIVLPLWCERVVVTKGAVYGIPQTAMGVYAHSRVDRSDSRMLFAGCKVVDFAVRI